MMKRISLGFTLTCCALAASLAPATAGEPMVEAAQGYVVHGIPDEDAGLPSGAAVDVLVDDTLCALPGLTFGEIVGPLPIEPGVHNFKVSVAADEPCTGMFLFGGDFEFAEGEQASIVAHLDTMGAPLLSKFENNLASTPPGLARAQIHHVAAVDPVDIVVNRPADDDDMDGDDMDDGDMDEEADVYALYDVANGDQATVMLRPGNWDATLFPAGGTMPAAGPLRLKLRPFTAYLFYAVGSLENGTFEVLAKAIRVKESRGRARTADGGSEDEGPPSRRAVNDSMRNAMPRQR